jgi:CRISPR system Cascade subunit CasD
MFAAALGRARGEDITDLARLWLGVRVDHQGVVACDYQTVESVPDTSGRGAETVVSRRWYLADAVFLAAVGGDASLLERLADALVAPAFPIALGRKSYVPTQPVVLGLVAEHPTEVLRRHRWLVSARRVRERMRGRLESGEQVGLRIVGDCAPEEASTWYPDHPVSFEPRRFLRRPVRVTEVPLRLEMIQEGVLPWRST